MRHRLPTVDSASSCFLLAVAKETWHRASGTWGNGAKVGWFGRAKKMVAGVLSAPGTSMEVGKPYGEALEPFASFLVVGLLVRASLALSVEVAPGNAF